MAKKIYLEAQDGKKNLNKEPQMLEKSCSEAQDGKKILLRSPRWQEKSY